jgi:hypothetical protein
MPIATIAAGQRNDGDRNGEMEKWRNKPRVRDLTSVPLYVYWWYYCMYVQYIQTTYDIPRTTIRAQTAPQRGCSCATCLLRAKVRYCCYWIIGWNQLWQEWKQPLSRCAGSASRFSLESVSRCTQFLSGSMWSDLGLPISRECHTLG